jgi:GNAT superfamily N-acetyltransferase
MVRAAREEDAEGIAEAHVDAIRTLGAAGYDRGVVEAWGAARSGERYVRAMAAGERFFVAEDEDGRIVGFAAHRVEAGLHRTAVYVRGGASRRGVGTALFRAAEAVAREQGAREIRVDASLVAVGFYGANGFVEVEAARHRLRGGSEMACVVMRKVL